MRLNIWPLSFCIFSLYINILLAQEQDHNTNKLNDNKASNNSDNSNSYPNNNELYADLITFENDTHIGLLSPNNGKPIALHQDAWNSMRHYLNTKFYNQVNRSNKYSNNSEANDLIDEHGYQICGVENKGMAIIHSDKLKEVIKRSNVTYSVLTYSTEYLDRKTQRLAIRHAFDIVTEVINVKFIEVGNTSDAVIQFQYGVDLKALGYTPDAIAYCEKERNQSAPGTNSYIQILFDINNKWVYLDGEKISMTTTSQKWSHILRTYIPSLKYVYVDFLYIALHEISHAIGLDHINGKNSMLLKEYRPLLDDHGKYIVPRLSDLDIIQFRTNYATRSNNFPCIRAGLCRDLHAEKREEEESAIALPFGLSLIKYGTETDDMVIEYSKESSGLALIQSFPFSTEEQYDVFISPNGAISFGQALDESTPSIESQGRNAIAVLYAPASDGTIYYRSEREEGEATREVMRKIRRAFQNAQDFRAQYSIIVTWEGLKSGEDDAINTFQVVLVTDGRTSYACLIYKEIGWTNVDGKFAQAGFYFHDGRNQKMVNAETDNVRKLTRISNFDEDGVFLFRISGQHPEDPKNLIINQA